jgi:hypothetical protein
MNIHVQCPQCDSRGSYLCQECICKDCKGEGKIKCQSCISGKIKCLNCNRGKISCSNCNRGWIRCAKCDRGKLPCGSCGAVGRIPSKFLFLTLQKTCPVCMGLKKINCQDCKATGKLKCSLCSGVGAFKCTSCTGAGAFVCNKCSGAGALVCQPCEGKGRYPQCSKCKGIRKLTCEECKGTGKVEHSWVKSLKKLSAERLKFEYEKRHREISNIQMQINRLSRELDEMYEWYEQDRALHSGAYNAAGAYPSGLDSIPRQINSLQSDIGRLEGEMKVLEYVLNQKWR